MTTGNVFFFLKKQDFSFFLNYVYLKFKHCPKKKSITYKLHAWGSSLLHDAIKVLGQTMILVFKLCVRV